MTIFVNTWYGKIENRKSNHDLKPFVDTEMAIDQISSTFIDLASALFWKVEFNFQEVFVDQNDALYLESIFGKSVN